MISYNVCIQLSGLCQVETAKKTGVLVFTNRGFQVIPEQGEQVRNINKQELSMGVVFWPPNLGYLNLGLSWSIVHRFGVWKTISAFWTCQLTD
jgi:hypothetical protein